VSDYLTSWLENECLTIEEVSTHSKAKGIRVLSEIAPGGWS
jgi:hypothetical protein